MPWRYLPPAHSPVSAAAVAGGLWGLASGGPPGIERWLADRYLVDAALLLDSGTSALRLAIESVVASNPAGKKVALPAYGCYDLATAVVGAGARVVFYDVDPASLGPDWESLAAALAGGAVAAVLVHQYGIPADLDQARDLCDARGAVLIEDAAQGAGAWWADRRLGAHGDLGILSFGRGKGMTAGGGGALLARNARGVALLEGRRVVAQQGDRGLAPWLKLTAQALLSHPMLYGLPAAVPWLALGETPYHEPWAPRVIAASEAAVLPAAADSSDREADHRRYGAARLGELLRSTPEVEIIAPARSENPRPGWLRFPVLTSPALRARAASSPASRLGVIAGYPLPLPRLPQLRSQASGDWHGAQRLANELVTLPTHSLVRDEDRTAIARLLS